jgi:hypothetical protein
MISLFKKEIIEEKVKSLLYIMLNYYINDSVIYNKIKDNINNIITDIKNINSSILIIYHAIYNLVVNEKVIIYRKILSLIYIYYIYFEEKSNKLYEIFYKDNLYEKKTFKSEEKPIEPIKSIMIEPIKSIMIGGNETLFNTVANLIENNIPYRNMKWKEFIIINDNIYIQKNFIYYIKKILNDIFYYFFFFTFFWWLSHCFCFF